MNKIVNIVSTCLIEKRHLMDDEIEIIVEEFENLLNIKEHIKSINFDYHRTFNAVAGFDFCRNTLHFNNALITERIFYQYQNNKNDYSFNEFYLIHQLMIILHELRHIVQNKIIINDYDSVIREIIYDSDILQFDTGIYEKFYHLFPIEKDAKVFSCSKMIEIINLCQYFDVDIMKKMYSNLLNVLLDGYHLPGSSKGVLENFYTDVYGDYDRYLEIIEKISTLSTFEKMSFNFDLSKKDLQYLALAYKLLLEGHNPETILMYKGKGLVKK